MYRKNITLFYILESLLSLLKAAILPVYVLYFRHYELTLFEVALLASVFETTVLIFEIPTGLFADRYGRKISTIFGFLLFAISGIVFSFWRDFVGFLAAEIIFGISETFISGALEALAVDSIDGADRDRKLVRLFANRTILRTSTMIVGMIGGGLLAENYLSYIFVPIILLGIGVPISFFLREQREAASEMAEIAGTSKITDIARMILENRMLVGLFAIGLLANLAGEGVDQYWQVLFSEIKKIDSSYYGVMTALGALLVVLLAKITERFYERISLYLTVCFSFMAITIFAAAKFSDYPAIIAIVFYFAMKEIYRPVISYHLNRNIESRNRATILSGYNLICSVGEVIAGVAVGIIASEFGVGVVFYISALQAVAILPVCFIPLGKVCQTLGAK